MTNIQPKPNSVNRVIATIFDYCFKVIKVLLIYYLSTKMICFAIPKLLFMQFRILHWESYIPLVEVSKYKHMWSFFGRSYNYNLFIGITEFLIGVLIVFKRTRLIALLLSLGVCTNILILNIEFDIYFAINHILVDLIITLVLLFEYHKDLYYFFIQLGGRFNHSMPTEKINHFKSSLPFVFLFVLSISYSIFAYSIKSKINEDVVGTYEIKEFLINDHKMIITKGKLGNRPMMFLEYNKQVVISVNDSLYFGRYQIIEDKISLRFNATAINSIKSAEGYIGNNSLIGLTNNKMPFKLTFQRIDGNENYLNDLYK